MLVSPIVLYSPIMLAGSGNLSANRAARALRAWGLGGLAAALLGPDSPLAFFSAQALYFAAPVLDGLGGNSDASDLAAVLDDPVLARAFAAELSAPAARSPGVHPPPTPADPAGSRAVKARATAGGARAHAPEDQP